MKKVKIAGDRKQTLNDRRKSRKCYQKGITKYRRRIKSEWKEGV